jgi:YidC/Oxa1 family membrane protein insertase
MFTTLIVQPIFNLLVLIYALLPGHNFGLAIIIFTVIIRLLLWPLVKRQLHQAKLMRKIQPELKRIAKETKGNRQKQSQLQMELYKERGINPFSSIGVAILQLPILIGLYSGLRRVINNPHQIVSFAYPGLQHLSWMKELSHNIHLFDSSLFGIVNLDRAAFGPKGLYVPAMIIVLASAVTQYFQAKQLMPDAKDSRGLRSIMREAGSGKQADQSEVSAAVGRSTRFFLPAMIFFFTVNIASALGLYWFVGGLVAFIQQSIVLREDKGEMEDLTDSKTGISSRDMSAIPEAEVVTTTPIDTPKLATAPALPKTKSQPHQKAHQKTQKSFKPVSGSTVTSITRGKKKGNT